jgi:succinate dehydrogenase/fumarate reductase flavoprotein subunit
VVREQLERRQYDVVIVGSGGAGSAAAQTAADRGARVLAVSKDPLVCSDSKIAEGIVTVRTSGTDADTEQALSSNLRLGGDDISEQTVTRAFAKDSRDAYTWLREQGIKPELNENTGQPMALPMPMGGHSLPRSIDHNNGGLDYAHACWNALLQQGGIDYLEDAWFLDVYRAENDSGNGCIQGGLIYHAAEGKLFSVKAPAVIIACGGLSTMYFPHTDTMRGNTGDSYAIAARAGAQLVDMEQVQFIPFAVAHPQSFEGLVIGEPVSAGMLGVIRDTHGKIIKSEIMVRTRAECAAAIAVAVAEGNGSEHDACFLDLTKNAKGESGVLFKQLMNDKIPGILNIVKLALGSSAAKFEQPWEVRPSAH